MPERKVRRHQFSLICKRACYYILILYVSENNKNALYRASVERSDYIFDLFQSLAEELKKEKSKGEVFAVQCDVSKEDDVNRVIKWTAENLGGVDILVNNAGVSSLSLLSGRVH
jgi:NAD(P)-dependent dehydrogenase (short-subunit alcohol dehydrogenase family)